MWSLANCRPTQIRRAELEWPKSVKFQLGPLSHRSETQSGGRQMGGRAVIGFSASMSLAHSSLSWRLSLNPFRRRECADYLARIMGRSGTGNGLRLGRSQWTVIVLTSACGVRVCGMCSASVVGGEPLSLRPSRTIILIPWARAAADLLSRYRSRHGHPNSVLLRPGEWDSPRRSGAPELDGRGQRDLPS